MFQCSARPVATFLTFLLAAAPLQAREDPLAAELAAIRAHLDAGEGAEAIAAARRLHAAVAKDAGFGLTNAGLTVEPAEGYGVYTPRDGNIYAEGEPVHAYVEPFGQTLVDLPDGQRAMRYDIRFAVLDADGKPLSDLIALDTVDLPSWHEPIDAYLRLTFRVSAPPGDYIIHAEITDTPTGRAAPVQWAVRFR